MTSHTVQHPPRARIVVLAKSPVPGRSKTRLTPPYSPDQAAALARAALQDTLDTLLALRAGEPGWELLLSLDGTAGDWLPGGLRTVPQRTGGHDERIAGALEDAARLVGAAPVDAVLLVGMDTPQLTPALLRTARDTLATSDSVLGPAQDGGWWLLGLRTAHAARAAELVVGVPTSTPLTGRRQRERLVGAGLRVGTVPGLRDVDTADDVEHVRGALAASGRTSRFARLAARLATEQAA